ncbi:RAD9, HUS1, RAD1-interacting nuclear orphan protein 1 [Nematolebias whitei]|uniref:RAD9, HUS1, RAD1-interacting nuclear orphan protein 1 n=1 Tax=Nematolebias whitei TaxID=451745 RepID=UPI001899E147|nr:RAD9, HUS1, RAD1-interacting nuclear orphan protein 1 [Nematolebias whitei]
MPRKVAKTEKPALLFLERPVRGAKLQNVPELRAALTPKEFFTETQIQHSSTLNSWVNPQFDSVVASASPVRRGRRKCQSATSVLDRFSQLSRKNRVGKFPSLQFQTGTRDKSPKPTSTSTKKGEECTVSPKARNQRLGSCQSKKTILNGHCSGAQKRRWLKVCKDDDKAVLECAASSVKCSDQPGLQSTEVRNSCRIPAEGASTPATTEVSSVSPPADVDAPEIMQGAGSSPSLPSVHFLLAQPCTPPCNRPDILVDDTPEKDYGVKVTWRRRNHLMLMLKERGHLSETDALIQS